MHLLQNDLSPYFLWQGQSQVDISDNQHPGSAKLFKRKCPHEAAPFLTL
jgi:hypothetical protein